MFENLETDDMKTEDFVAAAPSIPGSDDQTSINEMSSESGRD